MIRAASLAVLIALAGAAPLPSPGLAAGWQEVDWPFPRDAWPAGRAFHCAAPSCGGALEVYVRPKIGFCNCTTGVTDDAEVDAVSDLDMISPDFAPQREGEPVLVGGLKGRMRGYTITLPTGARRDAAGYAISSRCDLVAIAILGPGAGAAAARREVIALLESEPVQRWLAEKLGGPRRARQS